MNLKGKILQIHPEIEEEGKKWPMDMSGFHY